MPGRKSDVKDAQWIAKLLYRKMLRGSLVPDKNIRELRTYTRKEVKLQGRRTSILQEMERTLEMCNIRITSFTSTIDSLSVRKIIVLIISGESDPKILSECIHGRIKNKHKEKIELSLEGAIAEHLRFSLELAYEEFQLIEGRIDSLRSKSSEICDRLYKSEKELLESIPGISDKCSTQIIAESGADMKAFYSSKRYVSWVGFCSRNDESAGKFKNRSITKGNKYLQRALVQAAWAGVRTKESYFNIKFKRLTTRKGPQKSLIAIARKIAVIAWNVIQCKKAFDANLLPIYDPKDLKRVIEYHQKTVNELIEIFEKDEQIYSFAE